MNCEYCPVDDIRTRLTEVERERDLWKERHTATVDAMREQADEIATACAAAEQRGQAAERRIERMKSALLSQAQWAESGTTGAWAAAYARKAMHDADPCYCCGGGEAASKCAQCRGTGLAVVAAGVDVSNEEIGLLLARAEEVERGS
jgi:hypothetical protein